MTTETLLPLSGVFDADTGQLLRIGSMGDVAPAAGSVTHDTGPLVTNKLVMAADVHDIKTATALRADGAGKLTAGLAGTTVGTVSLENATSGSIDLTPATGALGTSVVVFPAVSGTVAYVGATQTFTGKTISGASNTLTVRLNTTDVTGTLPINKLATTGTPNGTLFLRDDGQWTTVPSGSFTVVTLNADYTLTAADDQKVFVMGASVIVTIPTGLTPAPAVVFMPKASASVTLHPTGGVTIDGSTSDELRSVVTDPTGFSLTPSYGTANTFFTTVSVASWTTLAGAPTDNAAFNTLIAGYRKKAATPVKLAANLTLDASNAGTGVDTYQDGFIFINSSTPDRTITINTGIRTDFACEFARGPGGAGNLIITAGTGVTIWQKGGTGTKLITGGTSARLKCTGTQDQFFLISDDITV
jgi:hypothetical protein